MTQGQIVLYRQPQNEQPRNGIRVHPAMITRVWSEECVNLSVSFDDGEVEHITSVVFAPAHEYGWSYRP